MNKWKAKYLYLCQGINNKESIKNAELFVEAAITVASRTNQSLESVVDAMLSVTSYYLDNITEIKEPLSFEEWFIKNSYNYGGRRTKMHMERAWNAAIENY